MSVRLQFKIVFMKCRFIGDQNDPLTRKWGIKKFSYYVIEKKKNDHGRGFIATISTPNMGKVKCPYDSETAFNKNWEISQ